MTQKDNPLTYGDTAGTNEQLIHPYSDIIFYPDRIEKVYAAATNTSIASVAELVFNDIDNKPGHTPERAQQAVELYNRFSLDGTILSKLAEVALEVVTGVQEKEGAWDDITAKVKTSTLVAPTTDDDVASVLYRMRPVAGSTAQTDPFCGYPQWSRDKALSEQLAKHLDPIINLVEFGLKHKLEAFYFFDSKDGQSVKFTIDVTNGVGLPSALFFTIDKVKHSVTFTSSVTDTLVNYPISESIEHQFKKALSELTPEVMAKAMGELEQKVEAKIAQKGGEESHELNADMHISQP